MKQAFYQLSSSNAYYVRRWLPCYQRRVYDTFRYDSKVQYTKVQSLGFSEGYEYGYCLGVL